MDRVEDVLLQVLAAIDEVHLRCAVIGGFAVLTWGIPRTTYDADVLLGATHDELGVLFAACERRGFQIDSAYQKGWRDNIRDLELVKMQLYRSGRSITTDMFLAESPFTKSALERALVVEVSGLNRQIPVIRAADLLLFKLMANRPKDRLDIQSVIAVQGVPEEDYLKRWAAQLGVEKELYEQILRRDDSGTLS